MIQGGHLAPGPVQFGYGSYTDHPDGNSYKRKQKSGLGFFLFSWITKANAKENLYRILYGFVIRACA